MNGRRRKALKAMFLRVHGREPAPGVSVVDNYAPQRLPNGLLYDPHAYEMHGMRYDVKKHIVIQPSEWRALKRALKTT